MKKSLSLVVLILVFFFVSTKESDAQFKLKLGPLVGMNFNIGTGSDLDETATAFGFVFGSQLDMKFTPVIGLITQVQFYDQRSFSWSNTGTNTWGGQQYPQTTLDIDYNLAYFLIEPLLKVSLPSSSLYFIVGPSFGFNIQGSYNASIKQNFQGGGSDKDKGSLKDLLAHFGLKGGAGYDIDLGGITTLTPQFSFEFGITNVISKFRLI
jgi:hypothetical protein